MTRSEYNDLHEDMCYVHDAELFIDGVRFFFEWNEQIIECFDTISEKEKAICPFLFSAFCNANLEKAIISVRKTIRQQIKWLLCSIDKSPAILL